MWKKTSDWSEHGIIYSTNGAFTLHSYGDKNETIAGTNSENRSRIIRFDASKTWTGET